MKNLLRYLKLFLNSTIIVFAVVATALLILVAVIVWRKDTSAELPNPPLFQLAEKHNILIGNHAIRSRINEPAYRDILLRDHNLMLADNTPNWYFTDGGMRPARDVYYFDQLDEIVALARENNKFVEAHHLLWGEEKWLPEWLKNGNYSEEELEQIINEHIAKVAGHYKGQILYWTVVNEAFTRGQKVNGLSDWWADNTGGDKDYIDQAFIAARQADPEAKLLLNDFMIESVNSASDEMYAYVRDAKARGIPIDGIGMQMHIDGRHPPTKDEVIANMKRFAELGVSIHVTEFDVNMNDVKTDAQSKNEIQADIYYEMARACIESEVCESFALLGITDKETWYNYVGTEDPRPLPFDEDYQPKPAYYALRLAFNEE